MNIYLATPTPQKRTVRAWSNKRKIHRIRKNTKSMEKKLFLPRRRPSRLSCILISSRTRFMMDTGRKTCNTREITSVLWSPNKSLMRTSCRFTWSNTWKTSWRPNYLSGSATKISWSLTRILRAATWILRIFIIRRFIIYSWRSIAIPEVTPTGSISRSQISELASLILSISITSHGAWKSSIKRAWILWLELKRRIN